MKEEPIDFAGLTASAKYLNKQSDTFHATLRNIQQKIVKLGIGLEVWNDDFESFVAEEQNPFPRGWILGLTKHDGAWCIAIREACCWDHPQKRQLSLSSEDTITPLLEAPRDRRVSALKLIPELVKRLKAEADRESSIIDEALKRVQALDASL